MPALPEDTSLLTTIHQQI